MEFNFLNLNISIKKRLKKKKNIRNLNIDNVKLNIGPGPYWKKKEGWMTVDIDKNYGDIIIDFKDFISFPFNNNTVECVYGSHVFEHISIYKSPLVFKEIYRVLKPDGVLRAIIPNPEESIHHYLKKNNDFLLFERRKERALKLYNKKYTIFECLREDFLSESGQKELLGKNSLAHQNAWDYETFKEDLARAGFQYEKIKRLNFKKSNYDYFNFEGLFPSEANEYYRSIYVEATK